MKYLDDADVWKRIEPILPLIDRFDDLLDQSAVSKSEDTRCIYPAEVLAQFFCQLVKTMDPELQRFVHRCRCYWSGEDAGTSLADLKRAQGKLFSCNTPYEEVRYQTRFLVDEREWAGAQDGVGLYVCASFVVSDVPVTKVAAALEKILSARPKD